MDSLAARNLARTGGRTGAGTAHVADLRRDVH